MKLQQLINTLQSLGDDWLQTEVIVAKDAEGNDFQPLHEVDLCRNDDGELEVVLWPL